MLLNLLNNYHVRKELICQDKYKKIKLKLKHNNARSTDIANSSQGGGSASVHAGIPPRTRPPWEQIPPDQAPPSEPGTPPGPGTPSPGPGTPWTRHPTQCMLGDTVNTRAVRILLECNLVELMLTCHYVFLDMQFTVYPGNRCALLRTTETNLFSV